MSDLMRFRWSAPSEEVPYPGPNVVGVDPSLSGTGLASSAGWCRVVGYEDKKRPITKMPHAERLATMCRIFDAVASRIGRPDLVVMELPALSRSGGGAHERGWLWWRLFEHLTEDGLHVGLMTPNQRIMYATGKGTGSKEAVVDAVARRWPQWQTGGNNNAADAVVMMAAGRDWLGKPFVAMPKTHRAAVDKATWPEVAS